MLLSNLPTLAPLGFECPGDGRRTVPGYGRTVPRELVHKESAAEVFLTNTLTAGDERIRVGVSWPGNHGFYRSDGLGCSDPLLVIETVRQAAIYLAHAHYAVPLSRHFIFTGLEVSLEQHEFTRPRSGPVQAVLDCGYEAVWLRDKSRGTLDCVIEVAGRPVGRARAGLLAVETPLYRQLRNRSAGRRGVPVRRRAEQLTGDQVGRHGTGDVLLGRSDGELVLRVDPTHPGYFEHVCDHVPGMVLIEAFRQAGHVARHRPDPGPEGRTRPLWLSHLSIDFGSFGELDDDVLVRTEGTSASDTAGGLEIEAVQSGVILAKGSVDFVPARFR